MRAIDEILIGFLAEAEDDYVGLWAIAAVTRWHLGMSDNDKVKALTLAFVRDLLAHGLCAGDYDYGTGMFHPWTERDTDSTLARIDSEWDPMRGDPNLAESICWFDMKRQ
jgi:hypothetical protein